VYDDPIGWIRRVAINRLLNEQRNGRRRRDVVLVSVRPPPADRVDDMLDLRARLDALPRQMRVTVTLFYLEDLSGEKIAELLGVSASTVRSHLADARARLRLELTEELA
jgi:RNA polymerase sigma factor (sigma-70 family)